MLRKLIQGLGLLAICILLPSFSVHAAEAKTVSLTKDGNAVEAVLELPAGGGGETVTSLQLSLQISASAQALSVAFAFDEALKSSVQIATYQESTGTLNLYVSGNQNLYAQDTLTLGKVILDAAPGDSSTATIRVNEDSFQTVNAAFGAEKEPLNAPAVITVSFGGDHTGTDRPDTNPNPDAPDTDNANPYPAVPEDGAGSVSDLPGGDPSNGSPTGQNNGSQNDGPEGGQNSENGQIINGKNDTTPKMQPPTVPPNAVIPNLLPSVNTADAPIQITELGGKKGITVTTDTGANRNTAASIDAGQSGGTNFSPDSGLSPAGTKESADSLYGSAGSPDQAGGPNASQTEDTGTFPKKTLSALGAKNRLSLPGLRIGIFTGVFLLVIVGMIAAAYITGTKDARRRKKARTAQGKHRKKKKGKGRPQKKAPSGARNKKR